MKLPKPIRTVAAIVRGFLSKKDEAVLNQNNNNPNDHEEGCIPEEGAMWDKIASNRCPCCNSKNQLGVVATGGLSLNVRCFECNALFWLTSERVFGVKTLESSNSND